MTDQTAEPTELPEVPRLRPQLIVLVVLLVLALGGVGWWLWERDAPRRVVVEFLNALEDGDTERAAAIAPDWMHDHTSSYAIPGSDGTGVSNWRIDGVERNSVTVAVTVTIEAEDGEYPAEFRLRDTEHEMTDEGVVTTSVDWFIDNVSYPVISVTFPTAGQGLVLSGHRLGLGELMGMELGELAVVLLPVSPGTHTVELPDLGGFVTGAGGRTVNVPPDFSIGNSHDRVELAYAITPEGVTEVERLFQEHVLECSADPDAGRDCPLRAGGYDFPVEDVETGSWTVLTWPELEFEETRGSWFVTSAKPGEAVYTWTAEVEGETVEHRSELPLKYSGWVDLTRDGQLRLRL